ncbi:MAG: phosphoserine aminotransferase apoenzyme [Polaromonas sp.]|nr:phosphoserine aminotransferase apoenzyme [Polaromonas sp.]
MNRPFNFSAGPAVLPEEVLRQAAVEMLDWNGSGMSVMEMSHRGKEFISIYEHAIKDVRELLSVPPEFSILFMQGGGIAENAIVPLNLSEAGQTDYVVTGNWSERSQKEAQKYCTVNVAASNRESGHTCLPSPASWKLNDAAKYVHLCTNETVHGVEMHEIPDLKALGSNAPLVIDFSSHMASRPVDWSRVGLAYGGAQKNVGPAGVTLVFVRNELLGRALPHCPTAFDYKTVADNQSMYNTPPTYAIYIAGLTFKWLKKQGGINAIEERNIAKAKLLYDYIDASQLYSSRVAPACRSRMNIPFFLNDASLDERFLAGAKEYGLLQLKGYKTLGGMRASLYNAMPFEGVQALVSYMREFEQTKA